MPETDALAGLDAIETAARSRRSLPLRLWASMWPVLAAIGSRRVSGSWWR